METETMTDITPLPIVVGGQIDTEHIIGRDEEAAEIRERLRAGESILLTGERRIGKTSLTRLVLDRLPDDWGRVYIDAERCDSLGALVIALTEKLQRETPVRRAAKKLWEHVTQWRGASAPEDPRTWQDRLQQTVGIVLASHPAVVLAIDELPTVLREVADRDRDEAVHLLRTLRALRTEHPAKCLQLLSGSIGFHHTIAGDADITAAVNDVRKTPVGALRPQHAERLAAGLLLGIGVEAARALELGPVIARATDHIPYYGHHLADVVRQAPPSKGWPPSAERLAELRDEALRAPEDPWQMQHYVDRIDKHFGRDGALARASLDHVSSSPAGLKLDRLVSVLDQQQQPGTEGADLDERVRAIVTRLSLDHYIDVRRGRAAFAFEVVRLGWRARRQLWP